MFLFTHDINQRKDVKISVPMKRQRSIVIKGIIPFIYKSHNTREKMPAKLKLRMCVEISLQDMLPNTSSPHIFI